LQHRSTALQANSSLCCPTLTNVLSATAFR
jgi:hypothetical protein